MSPQVVSTVEQVLRSVVMRRLAVGLGSSVGFGLAVVLGSTPAQARSPELYRCEWISEASPDAVIRFNRTSGVGVYSGFLYYRDQPLMALQEGQSQGYGSFWWSEVGKATPSGTVVPFVRDQPLRAAPTFWSDGRRLSANRVLLVGLGSALWYGSNPEWRQQKPLLLAAEGFWRLGPGCRQLT